MLPHALSLARALRPLMQRVPSRTLHQFDELATVQWIAETQIWLPILQGIPERRFDLMLVVENSGSMEVWPPVIAEFQQLLERTFRKVQRWELKSQEKLQLYANSGSKTLRLCNRKELLDPTRRRLILVVTDCISAAWYNGEMAELLNDWGQHHPVAILQMLPQRLWRGTGLSEGLRVNLRAMSPNLANRQLSDDATESWLAEDIPQGIKVPIVTLEADSLGYWANLVVGKSESWVQGVILVTTHQRGNSLSETRQRLSSEVDAGASKLDVTTQVRGNENQNEERHSDQNEKRHSDESRNPASEELSATQRLQRFRAIASPLAQQLAGYLAEMPLTLEVMRLVQQEMLRELGQIHLAEVFLGGLLKRKGAGWFDFHKGVRELLSSDSDRVPQEVHAKVSARIERRLETAVRDFQAQVGMGNQSMPPFATVGMEALKQRRGNYAQLALQLEREWALRVERGERFEFETVTVDSYGQIIKRERKSAFHFKENLGNGVFLEMVYIPGGTFLMGASKGEKGSYDDERPQHQVTIQPFYLGKYPVTQAQYQAIMGENPSRFKGDNRPVERVLWKDAVKFCEQLSKRSGRHYQLPSEAQWEYACRAGTTTPFHFGETLTTDLANYDGSDSIYANEPKGLYRRETTPVGNFPPNAFGLYDMHGNVWEWCQDVWHENYKSAPTDGSAWVTGRQQDWHVLRGGSWHYNSLNCRAPNRGKLNDQNVSDSFRVVMLR